MDSHISLVKSLVSSESLFSEETLEQGDSCWGFIWSSENEGVTQSQCYTLLSAGMCKSSQVHYHRTNWTRNVPWKVHQMPQGSSLPGMGWDAYPRWCRSCQSCFSDVQRQGGTGADAGFYWGAPPNCSMTRVRMNRTLDTNIMCSHRENNIIKWLFKRWLRNMWMPTRLDFNLIHVLSNQQH